MRYAFCVILFIVLYLCKNEYLNMKKKLNPFSTNRYISAKYFCNRNEELETLVNNVQNDANTTLISPRRMGKTALLYRFFEKLKEENGAVSIYLDVYFTRSLPEFVSALAGAIFKALPEKSPPGKRFLKLIKGFRASLLYDEISGNPRLQFSYQDTPDQEYTLSQLLQFLDNLNTSVIVAIDEFQQIAGYPEKNVEALLRTLIQQLSNLNFIFSGSGRHTLTEMFSNAKRPFYASTRFLNLGKIPRNHYHDFIREKFEEAGKSITSEGLDFILDWTANYTYYTQSLCNRVYSSCRHAGIDEIRKECGRILNENSASYLQYRSLLTARQWDFLVALAREESIDKLYTSDFLHKYALGTPSSAQRSVAALLDKEMVLETSFFDKTHYSVYDVFMMRWLQHTY